MYMWYFLQQLDYEKIYIFFILYLLLLIANKLTVGLCLYKKGLCSCEPLSCFIHPLITYLPSELASPTFVALYSYQIFNIWKYKYPREKRIKYSGWKISNICCIIHPKIRGACEDIVGSVTTPNDTFMQPNDLIQTHLYSHKHIYINMNNIYH